MPSDRAIRLCSYPDTVTTAVAAHPDQPITKVAKELFRRTAGAAIQERRAARDDGPNSDELDRAAKCGNFSSRPSDLFLKVYNDVLHTLDSDPLAGLVSPSLLGSSGIVPLSIVSVIPDIMRQYAELIVGAETEVFFATNYWEPSHSARIVAKSIRELSRRAVASGTGKRVVVKLMFDRGSVQQLVKNHVIVKPDKWPRVGLPPEHEIPGVALEVINYHRPPLGTFHAKFLIVDRKVVCLNSNNIQDRPNLEMMIQLEGPIVESFYDMALLSWSNTMNPPLPLLSKPPTQSNFYQFKQDNRYLRYIDPEQAGEATREFLHEQHIIDAVRLHGLKAEQLIDRHHPMQLAENDPSMHPLNGSAKPPLSMRNSMDSGTTDQLRSQLIAEHPNMTVPTGSLPDSGSVTPFSESTRTASLPESVSGTPFSDSTQLGNGHARNWSDSVVSDGHPTSTTSFRASSDFTSISGRRASSSRSAASVAEYLNAGNIQLEPTVDDWDDDDSELSDFRPHVFHEPHALVPIAMVNRNPTGAPGHESVHKVPQDVAWLSSLKYARNNVFIQTPTFNASPVVPATLAACRRGVEVTLYLDLGFNDQGEKIPFQGGTNEEVVHRMYRTLNAEGKGHEKYLKVFWYTGKDQKRPIGAAAKKRNCHVKFMSVDDQIAILGNGNHDTQSWFHSQEINVMIDSPQLVREWVQGIQSNQNTGKYGRVSDVDGVWRDGPEVVQASGTRSAGIVGQLKGLYSALSRVKAKGGF